MPSFEREQIEQAKRIMKPFVLRRLKRDVLQDLPKKTDLVVTVSMASVQKQHYQELVASYKNISVSTTTITNYFFCEKHSTYRKKEINTMV